MTDDFPIETRFALQARVGRGGSGDVFRATDRETGAAVAVKRMIASGEDSALDRFRREVRLLAQIDHPNVVRYVAHGVDAAGTACLVVEWLEGEDLAHRQRRQRLLAAEALEVVRKAATGLHALHQAGIVHRDVKPANLFLVPGDDPAGPPQVKVIDLGIARAAGEATLTTLGVALGTPFYMSPEQARGEERVTARADVFSLGVVLYELLSGRRPYSGNDFFAVIAKIVLQDPPRLREALPTAPPDLDVLVRRAMSKSPEDRFSSARDLADALATIPAWSLDVLAAGEAGQDGAHPRTPARPGAAASPERASPPTSQRIIAGATPAPRSAPSVELDGLTTRVTPSLSVTGERRVVTAIFAGFPAWAQDGELAAFEALAAEHGASSYPTLGRRRIAVFGGARTTGDEVVRAARAALEAAERLPGVRLAIATGRALSGVTGLSGDLIERGAQQVVDPAPRSPGAHLAGSARAAVFVDEGTARLLEPHFVVERVGESHVLSGPRAAPFAPRTLVGRRIPCVGRDREIASLASLYQECASEPVARVAVVTGAAGIGKSRVRDELLDQLGRAEPRPEILLSRGSPLAESSAFGLLGAALRRLAGILDGEPAAAQRAKLSARIGRRAPTAVPLLAELTGIPPEGPAPAPRDAQLTFDLLRAAWIEWLEAECAVQPVVIVLEDLHWGDRPSVRFVDAALRALAEQPLMVVAMARPEVEGRFPGLFAERGAQEIRLGPLTAKASERLVRTALGQRADDAAVQRIVARAEGNAFYIEELVRAAAEGAGEALPDTVLGMVQARLDALGPEPKRLLRAASIFGQTFWRGGVAALLGESPEKLTEPLDRLATLEVCARRSAASFPGEVEYTFRHAVVCDTAYAMLADADRKVGHRLAGAFLERAGDVDPAILALHFERGDDPTSAARHHQRAAEKALAGNDFAAAMDHAERAASAGSGIGRGRAHLVQAEAHRWRGEMAEAARLGVEAVELLPQGEIAWFHAVREVVATHGRLGRFDDVQRWAEAALAIEAAPGALAPKLAALAPAALQMIYAGRVEAGARLLAAIDHAAAAAGAIDPMVAARVHVVHAVQADLSGDSESALARHQAALACYESAGDRRGACTTLCNIGYTHAGLGAFVEAEDALRRALQSAERMGLGPTAALAQHNLGGVLHARGSIEEAQAVELAAVLAFERAQDPRLEGASRVYLSRILLTAGDPAAAEAEARRVADAPASPPPLRAGAQAAMARALLRQGRADEALAAASAARLTLDALGSVEDFEALIGLTYAEALFAAGDADAARIAVAGARARILARAARLGDPARARYLEAVPDNARCLALAHAWGA